MADNLSETQKQATIPDFFQVIKRWDLPIRVQTPVTIEHTNHQSYY